MISDVLIDRLLEGELASTLVEAFTDAQIYSLADAQLGSNIRKQLSLVITSSRKAQDKSFPGLDKNSLNGGSLKTIYDWLIRLEDSNATNMANIVALAAQEIFDLNVKTD